MSFIIHSLFWFLFAHVIELHISTIWVLGLRYLTAYSIDEMREFHTLSLSYTLLWGG